MFGKKTPETTVPPDVNITIRRTEPGGNKLFLEIELRSKDQATRDEDLAVMQAQVSTGINYLARLFSSRHAEDLKKAAEGGRKGRAHKEVRDVLKDLRTVLRKYQEGLEVATRDKDQEKVQLYQNKVRDTEQVIAAHEKVMRSQKQARWRAKKKPRG